MSCVTKATHAYTRERRRGGGGPVTQSLGQILCKGWSPPGSSLRNNDSSKSLLFWKNTQARKKEEKNSKETRRYRLTFFVSAWTEAVQDQWQRMNVALQLHALQTKQGFELRPLLEHIWPWMPVFYFWLFPLKRKKNPPPPAVMREGRLYWKCL